MARPPDSGRVTESGRDSARPMRLDRFVNAGFRWRAGVPAADPLDVTVQDVDAAERAALDIGATRLDGAGPNWRVYANPAGAASHLGS
jgi:hypothetical protein